jgi:threonine/homoserine/homoserine lactone efflux protein
VKMAGAAYLCWIGLKALRDAFRGARAVPSVKPAARRRTLAMAYVEGLLTNALNPKVSMFYLAAFPQFIPTGQGAVAGAFALVVVHSLLNMVWFSAMIMLLTRLRAAAANGTFQRWLKAVTGTVFIGFGIKLASYRP